jgi:hypothetical protein
VPISMQVQPLTCRNGIRPPETSIGPTKETNSSHHFFRSYRCVVGVYRWFRVSLSCCGLPSDY